MTLTRNDLRLYCLQQTGAVEEFPFGPDAAVYKVKGKMFALLPVDTTPPSISLKCDPVEAIILREKYDAVIPGYHLNKKHWNTVISDSEVDDEIIYEMIEDSYILVRQKLTKRDQSALEKQEMSE